MAKIVEFEYPNIPVEIRDRIFGDDSFVVISVIGKSLIPCCNKMDCFEILDTPASLRSTSDPKKCYNGRCIFYIDEDEKLIYLHFETSFDNQLLQDLILDAPPDEDYFQTNARIQSQFAQVFLFAASICNLLVLTDTGTAFDSSYLTMFKALSTIRDKCFMKYTNSSELGKNLYNHLGKEIRLCAPKLIFLFERSPEEEDSKIEQLEMDMEHDIYSALKNENLLSKNTCLFVLPKKLAFVHINRKNESTLDPVKESRQHLLSVLSNYSMGIKSEEIVEPYVGYGRPFRFYSKEFIESEIESAKVVNQQKKYSLRRVIRKHVKEILSAGQGGGPAAAAEIDGGINKSRSGGSNRLQLLPGKIWLECFEMMHQMLLGQEMMDTPDPEYLQFMEQFNRLIDTDGAFFRECCEEGYKKALKFYELNLRTHYSLAYHEQKLQQCFVMYLEYARGSSVAEFMEKLKLACDAIWMNNRQVCESLSLRGNPCIMPKLNHTSPLEHTSGAVFVSTCNCGRTQARREDPYIVRQANYDFYQMVNCAHCLKADRITFPVFQPSINDFCAANISISPNTFQTYRNGEEDEDEEEEAVEGNNRRTPLTQQSHSELSYSYEEFLNRATPEEKKKQRGHGRGQNPTGEGKKESTAAVVEEELNEIVVKVGEMRMETEKKKKEKGEQHLHEGMLRQPSTTEYLPGMVTTTSPAGLLPQFPSWSLMCIGKSLLYSHNTGIQEHFQGKFLSGTNMLLPWNVNVRLEHASNWTANYERSRKKQVSHNPNVFQLKIFLGMEYECPKGHRFIMSGPDKIMQSGEQGAAKNSGSKVAYNDMPLYYPCRCQTATTGPMVAQLMRVHVVTPKAPVNVILEPKVRIGNRTTNPLIFTTGLQEPVKLTQSEYWMLRLPYVYQMEEVPILPPTEVDPNNALSFGCLLSGMFGIVESEEQYE